MFAGFWLGARKELVLSSGIYQWLGVWLLLTCSCFLLVFCLYVGISVRELRCGGPRQTRTISKEPFRPNETWGSLNWSPHSPWFNATECGLFLPNDSAPSELFDFDAILTRGNIFFSETTIVINLLETHYTRTLLSLPVFCGWSLLDLQHESKDVCVLYKLLAFETCIIKLTIVGGSQNITSNVLYAFMRKFEYPRWNVVWDLAPVNHLKLRNKTFLNHVKWRWNINILRFVDTVIWGIKQASYSERLQVSVI